MANKTPIEPPPPASVPLLPKLMAETADPRDQWAEQVRVVCSSSRELQALQREHPETAKELLDIMLAALDRALLAAYRAGDRARGDELVAGFSNELRRLAVAKMRARLPMQPADIVKARHVELERNAWNAMEQDALCTMLTAGEDISDISPTRIETTGNRTITREQIRRANRPASWANDESWTRQFTSDERVRELAAQAEAHKNAPPRIASAGPRDRNNQPLEFDASGQVKRRW
ncbi:MAG: hypothetical protein JO211_03250 [Acidobacteriaceae bacterium]|nr:hypothetical protein [Acidobacteriaceae bacterium]